MSTEEGVVGRPSLLVEVVVRKVDMVAKGRWNARVETWRWVASSACQSSRRMSEKTADVLSLLPVNSLPPPIK